MKKGFTLMELLAVVVILSLLLIMTVPTLLDAINSKRGETFLMNAKLVVQTMNIYSDDFSDFDATTVTVENMNAKIGISGESYLSLVPEYINNNVFLTITGKDDWKNFKACGFVYNMEIISLTDNTTCNTLKTESSLVVKPNAPELATGMVPVKYHNNEWITTTENDLEWYNYDQKLWANAMTEDGSMWVWIPRYAYQISSGYHTSSTGTINVKFLKDNTNDVVDGTIVSLTPTYSGSVQTNYVLHPAFVFGTRQLKGIWVAKFEASAGAGSCYESQSVALCDVATFSPVSKPNMYSWRNISPKTAYVVARKMEDNGNIYGFYSGNIDSHVMKNTEWGAVAYLSKSIYGLNTVEVYINPADNYMTGCAGTSASSTSTSGCTNAYNTVNGVKASTTGNIYGIYDMSGGAYERTMANYNYYIGVEPNPLDPADLDSKYINVYTGSNYGYNSTIFGDAVYETSLGATNNCTAWSGSAYASWYSDQSSMPYSCTSSASYFIRGGIYSEWTKSGIFAFRYSDGSANQYITFRPVVILTTN